MSDHNAPIIEEFRANHGKVGGFFEGATLLILHTRGARTGKPQTVVLNHLPDGERFVVFGTKGGARRIPTGSATSSPTRTRPSRQAPRRSPSRPR
jgi:hypothetical protein